MSERPDEYSVSVSISVRQHTGCYDKLGIAGESITREGIASLGDALKVVVELGDQVQQVTEIGMKARIAEAKVRAKGDDDDRPF